MTPNPEKDFLGQIIDQVLFSEKSIDKSENGGLMATDQAGEGHPVAILDQGHEFFAGQASAISFHDVLHVLASLHNINGSK